MGQQIDSMTLTADQSNPSQAHELQREASVDDMSLVLKQEFVPLSGADTILIPLLCKPCLSSPSHHGWDPIPGSYPSSSEELCVRNRLCIRPKAMGMDLATANVVEVACCADHPEPRTLSSPTLTGSAASITLRTGKNRHEPSASAWVSCGRTACDWFAM